MRVKKNEKLTLSATGRFVIHRQDEVWESEANGITLDYFGDRPLGVLEMAILKSSPREFPANSIEVGTGGQFTASATGRLIFRINDHPARRGDNSGSIQVKIDR